MNSTQRRKDAKTQDEASIPAPAALRPAGDSALNSDLEVISGNAAESKALLDKVGARIEQHAQFLRRGERINDGWRVVIGLELALAKPHLDHGQFIPFLAQRLPDYDQRTARLWMEFADTVIAKSDQRSDLKLLPEKVQNGGVSAEELPTIVEELEKLTKGKSFREFMADPTSRKITFHCPHCGQENRGFPKRTIKCANDECGKKITVAEDEPNEGEKLEKAIAADVEQTQSLIGSMNLWRTGQHTLPRELLQELESERIELGKQLAKLLKRRN